MKIKYWLMISYFIVMLLPVAALYVLYVSISSLDQKQDFLEYMDITKRLSDLEPKLEKQSLYAIQPVTNYKAVDKLANKSTKISLYRPDGVMVYTSLSDPAVRLYQENTENLYKNLNEIEKHYRTYTVKKPVLHDGQIIGIYEVTFGRKEWIKGVNNRYLLLGSLFTVFFLLVYFIVVVLLNRKLNRPLQHLRQEMTAFAKGQAFPKHYRISKDEIGELLSHFRKMKQQVDQTQQELAKQQKEKEYIVAALSHDLKTPLTVIRAYSEALQNENTLTNQEKGEYKEILFEKLEYMKQMLDDLSMYTSLQSSQQKIELVEVDGEEFFDMLLSGYEEPCCKKGINLTVQQSVEGLYKVDAKQIIRIIDNIMGNAIRHTEAGSHIWLGGFSSSVPLPEWIFPPFIKEVNKWRKDGTVILIQNQGKAISAEQQDSIFEPFVQAEGARGLGGSSGLGLSIAKMLIEKHGGTIKLWSASGFGTLVACWIKERGYEG
ncbi:HAMP domain-containing sensor histidine kinase [Bacillus rubiinfantis]|uniref:HAMP domain-containing sensor histidine kinase n=1 Tax=Bacillus rubiinfantis TaxID=1499680 RepID=UPI0005AA1F48|nr:HAMP domain-containing sensor histidine kinase [Bacillus rubiinfantis]